MPLVLMDAGNSHIKWCCLEHPNTPLHSANIAHTDYDDLKALTPLPKNTRIYISAVANPERRATLRAFFKQCGGQLHIATIPAHFETAYSAELGIDRYLAMRAAANNAPCIIADMGTALTVDILNHDGHHTGGFITLGLSAHLAALTKKTSLTAPDTTPILPNSTPPGTTEAAITHGVVHLYTAWLERIAADYPTYQTILTGTDGRQLCQHLPSWQYRPALVLEGLADYATEHEQHNL